MQRNPLYAWTLPLCVKTLLYIRWCRVRRVNWVQPNLSDSGPTRRLPFSIQPIIVPLSALTEIKISASFRRKKPLLAQR